MDYDFIRLETAEGVATITLARPDVLNAFNRKMAKDLQNALKVAGESESVRAVLLTGAGRGFCAGQDLAEVTAGAPGSVDLGDIVGTNYSPSVLAIR